MKIYFINYQWEQMIETVYEYLISKCEIFFRVPNQESLIFHVEQNEQEKSLIVALMHDQNESYFRNNIQSVSFTGLNFARLINDSTCFEFQKSSQHEYLPLNEIRYLKLYYNDIIFLIISIVSQLLHLKKYFSIIKQKEKNKFVVYISNRHFVLTESNQKNKFNFLDKTKKVVENFL